MISRQDADGLRDQLLAALGEDAHNTQRLLDRLDRLSRETGIGAHAALLMVLTRLGFDDEEARRHWARIVEHHRTLSDALGRDPGLRVAVLDYFVHVNRQLIQPALIDLRMLEATATDGTRDPVTGLATDRMFRTALQHELRRARRYAQKTALVLFDLDDFGAVNGRFDAVVGDRLLREAAILLSNKIRDIDVASRPGEDELALLLPETDREGAMLVAERFRREIESYFSRRESGGEPVGLTVSAGIAAYPEDASTPEQLLERAAQALYQAKARGKNNAQVYHPERRRYLRFELEPGRFEIEVLGRADSRAANARDLSRSGIVFVSPERIEVGEQIEIRVADAGGEASSGGLRMRGSVVRLEELPADEAGREGLDDRYEIGIAFDMDWAEGAGDLLEFLERLERSRSGGGA